MGARDTTDKLGNIEIAIESITQEQLDQLLDFIIEKVDDMGLVMVGRTYFSKAFPSPNTTRI